jgi:adenosylcobinamide-phosphate synthase
MRVPASLRQRRARATAIGLLAGVALDQIAGDPQRGHPVALFGTAAGWLEARMWRDDRAAGAGYAALLSAAPALAGLLPRSLPPAWLAAVTAVGTWAVLGSRSLSDEADAVASHLRRGDLLAARRQLTHLVGRRTDSLDEAEIARAVVESVAENTSDAVVAPLLWGAVTGLPGLLAYRAVNTLDAMVGHHSPRYENFGWASARADDIANYLPARLTAALTAAAAPVAGGSWRAALAVARADGRSHPSPNAGVPEAAFAGALGLRLGGRNDYGSHVEDRPVLGGHGRAPQVDDIARAARLSRAITIAAAATSAAIAAARGWTRPRTRGLRVRSCIRFLSLNWCQEISGPAGACHFFRPLALAEGCGYDTIRDPRWQRLGFSCGAQPQIVPGREKRPMCLMAP